MVSSLVQLRRLHKPDATREAPHRCEIPRLTTAASRRGPNRGSHPPESPGALSAPNAAPEARRHPAGTGRYGAGFSRFLRLGGCRGSRSTGVTHRLAPFWRRVRWRRLVVRAQTRSPARSPVTDLILGPLLRHVGPKDATVLLPAPQRPPEQEVLPPEPRLVETSHPRRAPPGPPRRRPQRTPRLVPDPRGHLLR